MEGSDCSRKTTQVEQKRDDAGAGEADGEEVQRSTGSMEKKYRGAPFGDPFNRLLPAIWRREERRSGAAWFDSQREILFEWFGSGKSRYLDVEIKDIPRCKPIQIGLVSAASGSTQLLRLLYLRNRPRICLRESCPTRVSIINPVSEFTTNN
ncbi:hypothetical protein LXL04_003283 [Taraxacum kok-saghyz]